MTRRKQFIEGCWALAVEGPAQRSDSRQVVRETIDRGLANLEVRRKRYSSAIEILQRYEDIDGTSPNTIEVLARAHQGAELWE